MIIMFLSNNPSVGDKNSRICLVDYAPGAKNGPVLGVTYFTLAYIGKKIEKSSCLKP